MPKRASVYCDCTPFHSRALYPGTYFSSLDNIMTTTERKRKASRHILRRQGSSFGLRSSIADQEVLTLNALRAGVLVLESGVQLELLKEPLEANLIREQHIAALRDPARRFNILWSVRLYNREGNLESNEQWTLRSVSRGIRDALMSGWFIPGARVEVWIPAEVGGWWVKTKKRTRNEIEYEVEVVSVDWVEGYTWSIVKGFMSAVFVAMVSFIWTQISTRASNKKQIGIHSELASRHHPSPSKHKHHHHRDVSSEVSAFLKPTEVQLVVLAFVVDTVDFGEADVEVCDRGRCGKWFMKNLARFLNQEIINGTDTDVSGLLVHATEADTKEEELSDQQLLAVNMENEKEHQFCEDLWGANPKGESTYRLLLDPTSCSLAISKLFSSTYNERRWVCIGRVVAGEDSINATLNCEDGGVLALVELRDTARLIT